MSDSVWPSQKSLKFRCRWRVRNGLSDVALGTINQVAQKASVQPSTLVRFAQMFGYSGFSDFQEIFKEHIKGSWPEGRAGNDVQGDGATASKPPLPPSRIAPAGGDGLNDLDDEIPWK